MLIPQEVGERWAYRERGRMPITEVTVLTIGQQVRSPKVKVQFEEDAHEGRLEWVPFKRLRCLWDDRGTFLAEETKWDAINDETGGHPRFLYKIAETVFYTLELDDICWLGERNGYADIFYIENPDVFEAGTGIDLECVKQQYLHEAVDGKLFLSPAAVVDIAKTVAGTHSAQVMKYVRELELQAEVDRALPEIPRWLVTSSRYEILMDLYGEEMKHMRRWAGEEAATLSDQVYLLQNELEILRRLLNDAVVDLREEGRNVKAGILRKKYRELSEKVRAGEPVIRTEMWIDEPPKR